jgi:DNA-binding transcriptional regulator YhcF (GntR family)
MPPPPNEPIARAESKATRIARQIRADIESGKLREGQVLPSTRQLAEEFGVSPFTVGEALKELDREGLTESRDRSGRIVTSGRTLATSPVGADQLTHPRVIMVGGYAGSGKSELARMLAKSTHFAVLDKDFTRPVVEAALEALGESPHTRESPAYLDRVRPAEYASLIEAMVENLQCGNSVILSAPFLREFRDEAWWERTLATCTSWGATVHPIWVYCDAESMYTYIRRRAVLRDAAKLADWPAYLGSIDLAFRPPFAHVLVDNSEAAPPLQEQATALLETVLADE